MAPSKKTSTNAKSPSSSAKKSKMGSPMKSKSSASSPSKSSPTKKQANTTGTKKRAASKHPNYQKMITRVLTEVSHSHAGQWNTGDQRLDFPLARLTCRFEPIENSQSDQSDVRDRHEQRSQCKSSFSVPCVSLYTINRSEISSFGLGSASPKQCHLHYQR